MFLGLNAAFSLSNLRFFMINLCIFYPVRLFLYYYAKIGRHIPTVNLSSA